jgi:ATP-dependent Clp protease adaptor protein ClpS
VTFSKGEREIRRFAGTLFPASFRDPAESDQCALETMSGWQKELTPDEPAPSHRLRERAADDERRRRGGNGAPGSAVITRTKPQTKKPSLYRVLILNDDYTPMEFVVHVLERFFNKDREAATRIMLHVHHHGIGECGIFTYEVAETKVTQVMDFARKHQHPLQCVMEKK